ncbi:hypothetical protein BJ912DRAFT_689408 [Pholiota molesta]|nr:hypothetical protein BJ912DRAFT_689408 [Pholiota molesta]
MDFSPSFEQNLQTEEACRRLEEAISTFQPRMDAPAPISSLPPEIICKIFLFVQAEGSRCDRRSCDRPGFYGKRIHPLQWIKLTHVSRHWRNIAVHSPSLWVDLPIRNLLWVEEMLKRSKAADLMIEAHLNSSNNSGNLGDKIPGLELALKHGTRIKDLSLLHFSPGEGDHLSNHLPESAPRLKRLVIEGIRYAERTLLLPEHVLRKTEGLRHLKLDNCNINWNSHSHLLHSLTHLEICHTSPNFRPTGNQFWYILKGMPDLEFLHLVHALPIQTEHQAPWASGHIHFASLHTLQLSSKRADLEAFFSCVTFPPAATVVVNVDYNGTNTNTNSFGVMSSLARSYSHCSSNATFQAAILEQSYIYGFRVSLKLYMNALSNEQMLKDSCTGNPPLEVRFIWDAREGFSAEQAIANLAVEISNNPLLQYVKHLYLPDPFWAHKYNAEPTINAIGRLPWVQSIMAGDTTIMSIFHALKPHPHVEGTGFTGLEPANALYFPHLSLICLLGIIYDDDSETSDELHPMIRMLHDCLTYRQECGAEIKRLSLWNCRGLEEAHTKLLEQVVGDVDVQDPI